MEALSFSYNWNNKLDCKAFTTIRIYNPNKHVKGTKVAIWLKSESKGTGTIEEVKPFMLDQLNPFISYLDTGYSVEECRNVFLKMYPQIDFSVKKLALILIVKNKQE